MRNITDSLNIPTQIPLDYKIWYKTKDDITLGEDDYLAYSFYKGMLVYCAEERILYEWTTKDSVKNSESVKLFPNNFKYIDDMPTINGVEYAGKEFNFYKIEFINDSLNIEDYVTFAVFKEAVDSLKADILKNTNDINLLRKETNGKFDDVETAINNLKDYTDAQTENTKLQIELLEKALRGELTESEARLLLELESAQRDLEAQISKQSELLLKTVDELKNEVNQEISELNTSLDNLERELNSLPTDTELTQRQLDNLIQLSNIVEMEYLDVNFKMNTVIRDKFLPASEKTRLEKLQADTRVKYNALKNALDKAIEDAILTPAEVTDINNKLSDFRVQVKLVNEELLKSYDLLGDSKQDYFDNKIADTIVAQELIIEYSQYPDKEWHKPPYRDTDIYMRQKNGPTGDWYGPIRIKGEAGANGLSTFKSTAFIRSASAPATPTGGSWTSPNPTTSGWSDGIPAGDLPVYMSTRVFTSTGIAPQEAVWKTPQLVGDTPDIDYEFSDELENPGTPTTKPTLWYNDAKVTSIWMAIRTRVKGVWGNWEVTKVKGENGLSTFKSTAFMRVVNKPATPTGGSWVSPLPTTAGWSDGVPNGELPLYMTTRTFTNTGAPPQQATWAEPKLVADTPDIDYEFSNVVTNPGNPTSHPNNWKNDADVNSIWMAVRKKSNGVWGAWDVSKIKGEKGEDGANGKDGKYRDYQFAKNKDLINPPTTGWLDTPPNAAADEYIWQRSGEVIPPATVPAYWTAVRITGPAGNPGAPGKDAKPIISATQPSPREKDMVWIDTSVNPPEQKYWNGTIWILIGISKNDITKEIKEANEALQKTMEDALKDGIIDAKEVARITSNISTLESTKRLLDARYVSIYSSSFLSSGSKTNLNSRKLDFDNKHKALLDVCIAISKKTSVTPAEVQDYNNKQQAYNTSLEQYSKSLEECQNEINVNQASGGQEVGTRNLALKTNVKISNTSYPTASYDLTKNHNFVEGNDYTVTVWGKLGTGKTNFSVYNSGGSVSLVALTETSAGVYQGKFKWKAAANTHISVYPMPNTVSATSVIDYVQLSRGNTYPDWSLAPEDIDEAMKIAMLNAAQALEAANLVREKLNFIGDAKIEGNSVIAGLLLVGDASGNNGFISGITDKGDKSVRIGMGGKGYKEKELVPFRVLHDGTMYAMQAFIKGTIDAISGTIGGFKISANKITSSNDLLEIDGSGFINFRDSNKVIRIKLGLYNDGVPAMIFYDENGMETWRAGTTGIIYENFIAESYSEVEYFEAAGYTEAALKLHLDTVYKTQDSYWSNSENQGEFTEFDYGVSAVGYTDFRGYKYSAGKNPESEDNKKYEEFMYSGTNKLGSKVPDGWYIETIKTTHNYGQYLEFDPDCNEPYPICMPNVVPTSSFTDEKVVFRRFSGGKIVETRMATVTLQMSSPGGGGRREKVPYSNIRM